MGAIDNDALADYTSVDCTESKETKLGNMTGLNEGKFKKKEREKIEEINELRCESQQCARHR